MNQGRKEGHFRMRHKTDEYRLGTTERYLKVEKG